MAPEKPNAISSENVRKVVREILRIAASFESSGCKDTDPRSQKLLQKIVAFDDIFEKHHSTSRGNYLSFSLIEAYAKLLKKRVESKNNYWTPELKEELDFLLFCYAPKKGIPKIENLMLSKEKIRELRGPVEAAGKTLGYNAISEISLREYFSLKPPEEKKKGSQSISSKSLFEYPAFPTFFQTVLGKKEMAWYALGVLGFTDEEIRAALTAVMKLREKTTNDVSL